MKIQTFPYDNREHKLLKKKKKKAENRALLIYRCYNGKPRKSQGIYKTKFLELINELAQPQDTKTIVYLYTSSEHVENKIKIIIRFTMIQKKKPR